MEGLPGNILKNVWNLGNGMVNVWLASTTAGYVLVDSGMSSSHKSILKNLHDINVDPKEIKYVVLTHSHDDHIGTVPYILESSPDAIFLMHENTLGRILSGERSMGGTPYFYARVYRFFASKQGTPLSNNPRFHVIKNYRYENNENQSDSNEFGFPGKFVRLPGHTDDSIGVVLDDKMFIGDAAMNGPTASNFHSMFIVNEKEYYDSWRKIVDINPSILYAGHGQPFGVQDLVRNTGLFEGKIK